MIDYLISQGVGDAMATLTEFLQVNEYLTRFNQVKDKAMEFTRGVWSGLEGRRIPLLHDVQIHNRVVMNRPIPDCVVIHHSLFCTSNPHQSFPYTFQLHFSASVTVSLIRIALCIPSHMSHQLILKM